MEIDEPRYWQQQVTALARYLDGDQEPVILKIRFTCLHVPHELHHIALVNYDDEGSARCRPYQYSRLDQH